MVLVGARTALCCDIVLFRRPPSLRAGSVVSIVAPSGPVPRDELFRGLSWLGLRYRLRVPNSLLTRDGYLAGTDALRAEALSRAMLDPEVEAVVCARGGYGAMRIVDALPWDRFERAPKWIVGFSDVTTLHVALAARGIASIHGPNVTGLGRSPTPRERLSFIHALEAPDRPTTWSDLTVLRAGEAEGPVIGGNLAIVCAMASANRFVVPEGAVLVFEDVTERPYRVDRMLTSLRLAGVFDRASAVVFGDFTSCDPGPDGVTIDDVLSDCAASLRIPVVKDAPFGHGARNHGFVLGRRTTLSNGALRFL